MAVYGFKRSGLKTGVENNIFWSEIGSKKGEIGASFLGSIYIRFLGNCPPTFPGYKRILFFSCRYFSKSR